MGASKGQFLVRGKNGKMEGGAHNAGGGVRGWAVGHHSTYTQCASTEQSSTVAINYWLHLSGLNKTSLNAPAIEGVGMAAVNWVARKKKNSTKRYFLPCTTTGWVGGGISPLPGILKLAAISWWALDGSPGGGGSATFLNAEISPPPVCTLHVCPSAHACARASVAPPFPLPSPA